MSSDPVVVDRVTGTVITRVVGPFMNGRYAVLYPDRPDIDPVIADRRGHWSLALAGLGQEGDLGASAIPSGVTRSSLAAICAEVRGATALRPDTISPLIPPDCRTIDLTDTDRSVRDALPRFEDAVARPYERLQYVAEVTPTGRARRIDRRAPAYLAAHSEDWGRLTLSGVQPTRVLATHVDKDLNIYENAVLAEAIESAYRHIWARQNETRQIHAFFEVLERTLELVDRFQWRVAESMYEILGEAYEAFNRGHATEVESELERLRRQLGAIKSSATVRAVRPLGARDVHATNLLRDDHRYRVAHQLLLGLRGAGEQPDDASQEWAWSDLLSDYATFTVLVLLRAMGELGISVVRGTPCPGEELSMSNGWSIAWTNDHRIHVLRHDAPELVVVPIPHALDADESELVLPNLLGADCGQTPTLVVYLPLSASLEPGAAWELDAMTHEQARPTAPGVVPLSPIDARSELRATRAIRWVLLRRSFASYGDPVELRPGTVEAISASASAWTHQLGRSSVAVTRSPTDGERVELRAALSPRSRGYSRTKDVADQRAEVELALDARVSQLRELAACPVCGETKSDLEPRDRLTFWCRCQSCRSEWGLRDCPNGHRVPAIVPGGVASNEVVGPGWVTQTYGSLALAAPCSGTEEIKWFICPECRVCPADAEVQSNCPRCRRSVLSGSGHLEEG